MSRLSGALQGIFRRHWRRDRFAQFQSPEIAPVSVAQFRGTAIPTKKMMCIIVGRRLESISESHSSRHKAGSGANLRSRQNSAGFPRHYAAHISIALARDDFVQATGRKNVRSLRRPQKWHRDFLRPDLPSMIRTSNTAEAVLRSWMERGTNRTRAARAGPASRTGSRPLATIVSRQPV